MAFASNSAGYRELYFTVNGGSDRYARITMPAVNGTETRISCSETVQLSIGDYIEVHAYQNSGTSLTVSGNVSVLMVSL